MKLAIILVLLGLFTVTYAQDAEMVTAFRALQEETRQFNETVMSRLYPVMQEIPALKKHAYVLFRGMSRVYAPLLWRDLDTRTDMLILSEYGKWYFTEDRQFLEDQIVPYVTDSEHMKLIQEVRDGLDALRQKCIKFLVVYGGISMLESVIPTNLQPLVVSIKTMLSPSTIYDTIYKYIGGK